MEYEKEVLVLILIFVEFVGVYQIEVLEFKNVHNIMVYINNQAANEQKQ